MAQSEFDLKRAMQTAAQAKEEIRSKQALKLRTAYQRLFDSIVVGEQNPDGSRDVEFGAGTDEKLDMTWGKSPQRGVRKMEDDNCKWLGMVEHSGVEPLTSTMPLWRSTN